VTSGPKEPGERLENRLAAPMFALAIVFLILVAAVTRISRLPDDQAWGSMAARAVLAGLFLLWPVFLAEGGLRIYLLPPGRRTWKTTAAALALGVMPPLRIGAHSRTRPHRIWLPWMGWREIDFDLNKTLERLFSAPMSLMALLILPVLAVEYFWSQAVQDSALLQTLLSLGVGVIWVAFAIELVIRCSVAEKKLSYLMNHWIDLAVVLLPTLEFLPFLRLLRTTRLLKLQNFARLVKYYRLYGVAEKGWRGLVVVKLIRRLFSNSPDARIARLRSELKDRQDQIGELKREVDYYRRRIAAAEQKQDRNGSQARNGQASRETSAARRSD
jgi:hypothetical protein